MNFDEYIEKALEAAGIYKVPHNISDDNFTTTSDNPVTFYQVYAADASFSELAQKPKTLLDDLRTTLKRGDTVPIFKMHGTWSDIDTIVTTIEGYQSWFMRERLDVIRHLFEGESHDLLSVGYSGKDEVFSVLSNAFHPKSVFWIDLPGATKTKEVASYLSRKSSKVVEMRAEQFGQLVLKSLGVDPIDTSLTPGSIRGNQISSLLAWAGKWPAMWRHNFLAGLNLRLGRYDEVVEIIHSGFRSIEHNKKSEKASIIYGLFLISVAKAELRHLENSFNDIKQAFQDWNSSKDELLDSGISLDQWEYVQAEMLLHRGWIAHLLNRSVFDQIAAWRDFEKAYKLFEQWHDRNYQHRNFESSPEYSSVNWRIGLFSLDGGDYDYAHRCFFRMWDVDIFSELHIMMPKHTFGLALYYEAMAKRELEHNPSQSQSLYFKSAYDLGIEALELAIKDHHTDLIADLYFFLGRVCESMCNPQTMSYYQKAEDRYRRWNGDRIRAEETLLKVNNLLQAGKSAKNGEGESFSAQK